MMKIVLYLDTSEDIFEGAPKKNSRHTVWEPQTTERQKKMRNELLQMKV